ncbi:symporter [Bifidobacterium hapali]|uniref:Symporter n=1 Tax=Bifidobacterium hapali TaxID=1630172 RepID=A0A261G422_9BIFI|nr:symporter [Bifidobacterium hapali]
MHKYQRNSSIELLRICSMFMIYSYHFVTQNGFPILSQHISVQKFLFVVGLGSYGRVGVVVFFYHFCMVSC